MALVAAPPRRVFRGPINPSSLLRQGFAGASRVPSFAFRVSDSGRLIRDLSRRFAGNLLFPLSVFEPEIQSDRRFLTTDFADGRRWIFAGGNRANGDIPTNRSLRTFRVFSVFRGKKSVSVFRIEGPRDPAP